MYIKLTKFGHLAILSLCAKDEAIHAALNEEVVRTSSARVIVNAPYAAWKFAYRRLYDTNYGPRGGKRVYGKTAVFNAMKMVTKELNYIDTHPALQGLGMFGIEVETFPVWKMDTTNSPGTETRFKYSPYPQPGHQFVVLVPKWEDRPDSPRFTWWVERSTANGRLDQESLHLPLWRVGIS